MAWSPIRTSRKDMAHRKTLNEKQLAVLRWIAEGCVGGVMDGNSHRISVAALRKRGFVKITGRGPTWSAQVTAAGREYLDRADGPNPPAPRQPNTSVTEQLVNDVIAAGGTLRVRDSGWHRQGSTNYAHRAVLAERYGKVPKGKRLSVNRISSEELQLELVDALEGAAEEVAPVPVPERVARYHLVVRQFRDRKERHEVSRAALPRLLRILHGLVLEAERRGYEVALVPTPKDDRYGHRTGWSGAHHGHIIICVNDYRAAIRATEEGLQSRTYWEQRNRVYLHGANGVGTWTSRPLSECEANATGRLTLTLVSGYSERTSKWADRKSRTLEERRPELMREIEMRMIEARHRREDAEREAAARQRAWEAAMARARERHAEHHRGESLRDEIVRWHDAEQIRAYCDAAESLYDDDPEAMEWIAWARRSATTVDPLQIAPRTPAAPESVSPEELRPFLDGWDPYGPDKRAWRRG
jgi:hypothetical protein